MDETLLNHDDVLMADMPNPEKDILCPPKSTTKNRPRKGPTKGGKKSASKRTRTYKT